MIFIYVYLSLFAASTIAQNSSPRVLIYSATAAFRHDSIPTATRALKANGANFNITFEDTEDRNDFNDNNLAKYDAVLFLSTTGEVLDAPGKSALEKYLNSGGNFVGIHSASDSLRNTTFFVREIGTFDAIHSKLTLFLKDDIHLGAKFDYHAHLQAATVNIIGPRHPSTDELPESWSLREEMYNFESDPRTLDAVVVLSADESSYTDNGVRRFDHGTPHPLAWYQEQGAGATADPGLRAGRSFYTSLGHLNETWQDPIFLSHVLGGISWTLQSNTTRAYNSSGVVGNTGEVSSITSSKESDISGGATTATSSLASPSSSSSNGGGKTHEAYQVVITSLFVTSLCCAM